MISSSSLRDLTTVGDRLLGIDRSINGCGTTHILAVLPRVKLVGSTRGDVIGQLDHRRPLIIAVLVVILAVIVCAARHAVR